jgi:DNA repair exonuclease SbcCD ATPase subunit
MNNLKKAKKELEEIIEAEKHRLEVEEASCIARIEETDKRMKKVSILEKKLTETKDELARLVFLKKERVANQREVYSLSREIKNLKKADLEIEKKGTVLADKINLLTDSPLQCPICQRKLTNPYKTMLLGEFKKRHKEKRRYYKENLSVVKNNQRRIKFLGNKIRETDIILLAKEEIEKQKKSINSELEKTKKLTRGLPKLYERKEYLESELKKKSFAPLSQKMLKKIKDNIKDS